MGLRSSQTSSPSEMPPHLWRDKPKTSVGPRVSLWLLSFLPLRHHTLGTQREIQSPWLVACPVFPLMREIQDSCLCCTRSWHFPELSLHNFTLFVLEPSSLSNIDFIWCLGGFFFAPVSSLWTSVCSLGCLLCSSVKTFFLWFCFVCFMLSDCCGMEWMSPHRCRLVLCGWFQMLVTFMVCRSWRGGPLYTLRARIGMSYVCQTTLSYALLEFYHNFFWPDSPHFFFKSVNYYNFLQLYERVICWKDWWVQGSRKNINLRDEWAEKRWRAWVFPCQRLNTQRLVYKGNVHGTPGDCWVIPTGLAIKP